MFKLKSRSKKRSVTNKGSINLGISTIVVLVIAMVLIAAGISFIRGFFNLGEKKLAGAFEVDDFGMKPTRTDPLVLDQGKIRLKLSGEEIVKAGFYNAGNSELTSVQLNITSCTGGDLPKLDTLPQAVDAGAFAGFKMIVSKGEIGTQGTYICTMIATNGVSSAPIASTQIEFEVYS
ncbi:hypothetical protein COV13_00630 [Candidatus Woesearchaeota archaeon CG10_big_fil_rev_8_21_14_0_10_32_9]|nr:MAG: hypothetical protein COV13_00630 [Candidatus Woesearchaeota archaeon CG10_big_fil_rev_8_21_14_0_10_32_9]